MFVSTRTKHKLLILSQLNTSLKHVAINLYSRFLNSMVKEIFDLGDTFAVAFDGVKHALDVRMDINNLITEKRHNPARFERSWPHFVCLLVWYILVAQ